MPHYIGRSEARALHGEGDPGVDDTHVFQGDIFHSLELMSPRAGGATEWPVTWAIVLSHHCEWTKALNRPGRDYPIVVAPLREFSTFSSSDQGNIAQNRMLAYLLLPREAPLDQAFVVDLRLMQPIPAADLSASSYVASLGPDLSQVLQAKVVEFFLRDRTLA